MTSLAKNLRVLIVYWHPEPKSFNGALFCQSIATLSEKGHEVKTSDLHAMKFDPVSGRHNFATTLDPYYFKQQLEEMHATDHHGFAADLEEEMQKLEWADLLIVQCPLWWFSVPAMIKGWFDRVLAMKRFYGGSKLYKGADVGKKALLSITTGGPENSYMPSEDAFNGDIRGILRPLHRGIFEFCGYTVLAPHIVYSPVRITADQRTEELLKWQTRLTTIEHESAYEVGR